MTRSWSGALAALCVCFPAVAAGQTNRLEVQWPSGEHSPASAVIGLDLDDDNDDGVPDAFEQPGPDATRDNDVVAVSVLGVGAGAVRVHAEGGVRVLSRGALSQEALVPVGSTGRASVQLVGTSVSQHSDDASVTFTSPTGTVRVGVTVVAVAALDGGNDIVWPHRDALGVSHEVTNNETLPRNAAWDDASPDRANVRVEVWDPGATSTGIARIEALGTSASFGLSPGAIRSTVSNMILDRSGAATPLRSRFVRLVGDDTDLRAPGVQGQTLLVGLRDRVHVRYRRPGAAGEATTDLRVGRPGNEDGPLAARSARWHLVVMRDRPGGRPMVGSDDASAMRIAREQVTISNEIYLQCMMTFGDPSNYPVSIDDPPDGSLIAIGDDDGLVAGGGEIRLRVNGHAIATVRTQPGWQTVDTAEAVAGAITEAGFVPRITLNRRTDYGADGSTDILVRDAHGRPAEVTPAVSGSLTSDRQQTVALGRVDFVDGLDEFNNLNSSAGTLEERTLLKSLMDDDPTTVDLFIINRFTHQSRIGEAFVEGDGGAILNALVIDRAGVAAEREAWTQSHEAGHVFLNQPWHPDNMGPDRPWLLMDADASLGTVAGPKRLGEDECARITSESGVDAVPPLVQRYDPVQPSARAAEFAHWPPNDPYPRASAARTSRPSHASSGPPAADRPGRDYGLEIH